MADNIYTLHAQSPLAGFGCEWQGLAMREAPFGEMISVAKRAGDEKQFDKTFEKAFGAAPPQTGQFVYSDGCAVFWTAPNQWFVQFDEADPFIDQKFTDNFGSAASITLQSDAWAQIEISGQRLGELMERLSMLDVSDVAFPAGSAARTLIHHINCFLLRPDNDKFYLLCARSYAKSFADSIVQTATAIFGEPERQT